MRGISDNEWAPSCQECGTWLMLLIMVHFSWCTSHLTLDTENTAVPGQGGGRCLELQVLTRSVVFVMLATNSSNINNVPV